MNMKLQLLFYLLCTVVILLFSIFNIIGNKFKKSTGMQVLIPNIVHYILFNKNTINFITYLSMVSVIKIQKPLIIFIHANKQNFSGVYWHKMLHTASKYKVDINISFLTEPTHVYGQRLSSVYHASDISRLFVLRKYGGIYLDTDMVMINNVDNLRGYDCVVGLPKKEYLGSQFILAKPSSEFLKLWQEGYKKYRPRDWYYNAGKYPTELLEKNPRLAHVEPEYFGVQYLLDKLLSTEKWDAWKRYYGIHILQRHDKIFDKLNETLIKTLPINFAYIAQWILEYQ